MIKFEYDCYYMTKNCDGTDLVFQYLSNKQSTDSYIKIKVLIDNDKRIDVRINSGDTVLLINNSPIINNNNTVKINYVDIVTLVL